MTSLPQPDHATALELERLRGELGKGFAEVNGSLALLVLRSEQSERQHAEHRAALGRHDERLDDVDRKLGPLAGVAERLKQVERKVWMTAGGVTALVTASEIAAVYMHH